MIDSRMLAPVREAGRGYRVTSVPRPDVDTLVRALVVDPARLMTIREPITCGNSSTTGRLDFEGRAYFIKRYNVHPRTRTVRNLFRRSPVMREWRVGTAFRARSLPVPEPLIAFERRRFRVSAESCLVFELLDGYHGLDTVWPGLDRAARGRGVALFGDAMRRVYRAGAYHRDLRWRNIMIRLATPDSRADSAGTDSLRLTDLVGNHFLPIATPHARRRRDTAKFLRDADHFGLDGADRAAFLACFS